MTKGSLAHKKMSPILRIVKAFLIFVILISFAPSAFSSNAASIEQKRQEAHAKVIHLKRLETAETNKLYRNQKRLENAQKTLSTTKKQVNY